MTLWLSPNLSQVIVASNKVIRDFLLTQLWHNFLTKIILDKYSSENTVCLIYPCRNISCELFLGIVLTTKNFCIEKIAIGRVELTHLE